MLIAKWLLALGTFIVLGGAVVGFVGIYQHPADATIKPTPNRIVVDCPIAPAPIGTPPRGSQPLPPLPPFAPPGPPPEASPTLGQLPDTGSSVTCTARAADDTKGGGPVEDANQFTGALKDSQRWLAFVAYGVLLLGLGIAFLTSAGVIGIFTAVITPRVAPPPKD